MRLRPLRVQDASSGQLRRSLRPGETVVKGLKPIDPSQAFNRERAHRTRVVPSRPLGRTRPI